MIFQVNAPEAKQIQVDLGKKYDMQKNSEGVWEGSRSNRGRFHYYSLVLDGISVCDPLSQAFFGMGRMASGIEIPRGRVGIITRSRMFHTGKSAGQVLFIGHSGVAQGVRLHASWV